MQFNKTYYVLITYYIVKMKKLEILSDLKRMLRTESYFFTISFAIIFFYIHLNVHSSYNITSRETLFYNTLSYYLSSQLKCYNESELESSLGYSNVGN